ncbi:MAG: hypothetical protein WB443_11945, partial [Nitrososphaeraceae archaeon]
MVYIHYVNSKNKKIAAIAAACAIMMMASVPMWTAAANAISSNYTGVASDGTAIAVGRASGNYPNAITLNSQGQMSPALIRFDT